MFLKKLEVGSFMSNCYILGCQETKEAVVIDPGDEPEAILAVLEQNNFKLSYIINTHGHIDHIGANQAIKEATGVPIIIHKDDASLFQNPRENLSMFVGGNLTLSSPDREVEEGDVVSFGNHKLEVIHTPGHTRGGMSLKINNAVFTGDTLFASSIGRTDLPGGNYRQIIKSIKEKIFPLGDEMVVYPGHGPESTIGHEKKVNPFLQ